MKQNFRKYIILIILVFIFLPLFSINVYASNITLKNKDKYAKELLSSFASISLQKDIYNQENKTLQNEKINYYKDKKIETNKFSKTEIIKQYPSPAVIGSIYSYELNLDNEIKFTSSLTDDEDVYIINYSKKGKDNMVGFKSGSCLYSNKGLLNEILSAKQGDIIFIKTVYGEFRYKAKTLYYASYDNKNILVDGEGTNVLEKNTSGILKIISNIPDDNRMFCAEFELLKGTLQEK